MLISLVLCISSPWAIHAVHFSVMCAGYCLTGVLLSLQYLYLLGSLMCRAVLYYVLGCNCIQIVSTAQHNPTWLQPSRWHRFVDLQFRINWGLISLFWEQWKERFKAVFGTGRKTRKGRLAGEINVFYQSYILALVGSGGLKLYWERFSALENNSQALVSVPRLISNVCRGHRMEERWHLRWSIWHL